MNPNRADNSDEYRRRICRAVDFIQQNLAESPSVDEIARAAPFSKFHFQRLFKALVGETVAEFTRRIRLETAARRLLFSSQTDITGLAFDLGFSSSQNFAKAFRKHFDMSPTEFVSRRLAPDGSSPTEFVSRRLAPDGSSSTEFVSHRLASDGSPSTEFQDREIPASEDSTNGNIDRTDGNAQGDDDSYDPATVLIGTRTEASVINVEVVDLPAVRVAYRRHFGSYSDFGVQQAFDELRRWAEPRGLHDPQRCIGIPWDDADITPDDRCRFDACQIIEPDARIDAGINEQTVAAGRYAVYSCEVVGHDFDQPWTELMQNWLPFSGYQPADGPRFERYLSDGSHDPDGRWQIEICLPVMPL